MAKRMTILLLAFIWTGLMAQKSIVFNGQVSFDSYLRNPENQIPDNINEAISQVPTLTETYKSI